MPDFIPGLELSRLFYVEAVKPVLDAEFPGLRYDAALIGYGSEVLGFDTEMSRDHSWGPRLRLFLSAADLPHYGEAVDQALRRGLPYSFRGYPTSFVPIPGEASRALDERSEGEVDHFVWISTVTDALRHELAYDEALDAITPADWMTFPQHKLRTLTHGAVYHSGLGEVDAMRERLRYYPRDVWLYLMAAGWMRISQEEPFMGRTGDVGDDLGSRVIAARLVRDLMMLCFLIERVYAPYPKWFGTGFSKLACAPALTPLFERALSAQDWREREKPLSEAYSTVAGMHNALGITEPLATEVSPFHNRPYLVIHGERFSEALLKQISDAEVKRIAEKTLIGSIDQYSDSTDLRENTPLRAKLAALYRE